MYSSDGPDFEFVQQKRKEGLSIHEAVWQLAWKKSGPEMASLEAGWKNMRNTGVLHDHNAKKRLTLQPVDAATGGGRCRDAWQWCY